MPGFMQSIKSHLPQSPFSPSKKSTSTIIPPEVITPLVEGLVADAQPSSEVLPAEALLQPSSSTVALTLPPADCESSQHSTPGDPEPALPEEPVSPLDSLAQPDVIPAENEDCVEAVESSGATTQPDAALEPSTEAAANASTHPEEPEAQATDSSVVESSLAIEASGSPEGDSATPQPQVDLTVQPEAEVSVCKPEGEDIQDTPAPSEEVAPASASNQLSSEVSSPMPEAALSTLATTVDKENYSSHVKRNKSKKTKGTDTDESAPIKPRKSNPLAGKLRSVIEQVRAMKAKKDKESPVTPPAIATVEPTPTPLVAVIAPTPTCEEVPASA